MKNPDGTVLDPTPRVGLLLLSHGPLADALRETVQVLEPAPGEPLGALSLAWDEAPESASERVQKAISAADRGRGVRHRPHDRSFRQSGLQESERLAGHDR